MARRKRRSAPRVLLPRLLKAAAWLLALAATAAGLWFGSRTAWQALARRPEFRLDTLALSLENRPECVRAAPMTEELRRTLDGAARGRSLFDAQVAHLVGGALGRSPWVLQVARVSRQLPNSLRVGVTFRRPAGVVWMKGQRRLVDRDGHWLPEDLYHEPPEWAAVHVPVIEDRLFGRPPPVGQRWNGPRFAVGARLTEFLRQAGVLARLDVSVIDVSGVGRPGSESDIALVVPWTKDDGTLTEARVLWGKSSVYEDVDGLAALLLNTSDEEKARKLLHQVGLYPGLRGIEKLDLRFRNQNVFRSAY